MKELKIEDIAKVYDVPVDFLTGDISVNSGRIYKFEKWYAGYHYKILRKLKIILFIKVVCLYIKYIVLCKTRGLIKRIKCLIKN